MSARFWVISLMLLDLALVAVAVWQYFSPNDSPGLIVEGPNREVSHCSPGQTTVLTFLFHNHARHPVQIVGLASC